MRDSPTHHLHGRHRQSCNHRHLHQTAGPPHHPANIDLSPDHDQQWSAGLPLPAASPTIDKVVSAATSTSVSCNRFLNNEVAGVLPIASAPRPAPSSRPNLISLEEHESAMPLVAVLHDELPSSPQQEKVVVKPPAPHTKANIIVAMVPPSLIYTIIVLATSLILRLE
jgi:hypothetical protein